MNGKQETINTYDNNAAAFAAEFDSYGPRSGDIEHAFSFIQRHDPKVLEIGCGSGRDARVILEKTNDYTGIDISEKLLEIAQEHNPAGKFISADMETYDFPKNLDIIFAFASLLHTDIYHLEEILKKAATALNPGGVFYISLKYADHYSSKRVVEPDRGARTYYYYSEADIDDAAPEGLTRVFLDHKNLKGTEWVELIYERRR